MKLTDRWNLSETIHLIVLVYSSYTFFEVKANIEKKRIGWNRV